MILAESATLIETTLVRDYGLPADEALRLSRELAEWFDRLARRPGTPQSIPALRSQLISMVCKVGHVYWSGKIGSGPPENETLRRTLSLGPEIIAFELEKQFEESDRRPE